jgi:hypothetical protein
MPAQFSRMTGAPAIAILLLSAAACTSGGEESPPTPANLTATIAGGDHTPSDASCVAACASVVACVRGHGGGYGDYSSGYGDYGGGYGDYGSGYGDYGGGYGDYGGGYGDYGAGYGDYGAGYGDYGSGYGDYGSGYGDYGSGYGDYGGYAGTGKMGACVKGCQALPAPARRKIVACITARTACHEKLACE